MDLLLSNVSKSMLEKSLQFLVSKLFSYEISLIYLICIWRKFLNNKVYFHGQCLGLRVFIETVKQSATMKFAVQKVIDEIYNWLHHLNILTSKIHFPRALFVSIYL